MHAEKCVPYMAVQKEKNLMKFNTYSVVIFEEKINGF